MCDALKELFADELLERERVGEERGREFGRELGEKLGLEHGEIKGIVEMCREFQLPISDVISRLTEKFQIPQSQAQEYIKMYY